MKNFNQNIFSFKYGKSKIDYLYLYINNMGKNDLYKILNYSCGDEYLYEEFYKYFNHKIWSEISKIDGLSIRFIDKFSDKLIFSHLIDNNQITKEIYLRNRKIRFELLHISKDLDLDFFKKYCKDGVNEEFLDLIKDDEDFGYIINKNKDYGKIIFEYKNLNMGLITRYGDKVLNDESNKELLSKYNTKELEKMKKVKIYEIQKLDEYIIKKDIQNNLFLNYSEDTICLMFENQVLSEKFLENNESLWIDNIKLKSKIFENQVLSEKFLNKHIYFDKNNKTSFFVNKVYMSIVLKHQVLSENFILKNIRELPDEELIKYQVLSENIMKNHILSFPGKNGNLNANSMVHLHQRMSESFYYSVTKNCDLVRGEFNIKIPLYIFKDLMKREKKKLNNKNESLVNTLNYINKIYSNLDKEKLSKEDKEQSEELYLRMMGNGFNTEDRGRLKYEERKDIYKNFDLKKSEYIRNIMKNDKRMKNDEFIYEDNYFTQDELKYRINNKNWKLIVKHQKLSEEFIEKHMNGFDNFYIFIGFFKKLSDEFIIKHINKINFKYIYYTYGMSETLIEKLHYLDNNFIDWTDISYHPKYPEELSEEFIDKYKDKINFDFFSENKIINIRFFEKYKDKLNWVKIIKNKQTSKDVIERIYELDKDLVYHIPKENLSSKIKNKENNKNKKTELIREFLKNYLLDILIIEKERKNIDIDLYLESYKIFDDVEKKSNSNVEKNDIIKYLNNYIITESNFEAFKILLELRIKINKDKMRKTEKLLILNKYKELKTEKAKNKIKKDIEKTLMIDDLTHEDNYDLDEYIIKRKLEYYSYSLNKDYFKKLKVMNDNMNLKNIKSQDDLIKMFVIVDLMEKEKINFNMLDGDKNKLLKTLEKIRNNKGFLKIVGNIPFLGSMLKSKYIKMNMKDFLY